MNPISVTVTALVAYGDMAARVGAVSEKSFIETSTPLNGVSADTPTEFSPKETFAPIS